MNRPPLHEQVIVITGASSGIGRETAIRLGDSGARLVLAARDNEGLEETAAAVRAAGGMAEAVPTDVSVWAEVDALADRAVTTLGRIDSWVNNAGIALYGDISQISAEEMERVIAVNLLGEMYGCKAAFERMKHQESGVIINVSSVLARRSVPLQSAYSAAKHGVSGFTEALRLELKRNWPHIEVAEVLPSSMNTPLFRHARSYLGKQPAPIAPVYHPELVAKAIERMCVAPKREIFVGGGGKLLEMTQRVAPGAVDRLMAFREQGFRRQEADFAPTEEDNLDEPMTDAGPSTGGWRSRRTSLYTTAAMRPYAAIAGIGAAGAATGLAALKLSKRRNGNGSH